MNIKALTELLGPNIYINGGPKELATENWFMAAKFNEKDFFNIFFTDETERTISKFNIGNKPQKETKEEEKPTGEEKNGGRCRSDV